MSPPDSPTLSDFGILNLEACDPDLRNRVIVAVRTKREKSGSLNAAELNDVVTYITQLEDALLRYRCRTHAHPEILDLLKCTTGLDIKARAYELDAMSAEDA